MSDASSKSGGGAAGAVVVGVIGLLLAFTNPTAGDIQRRIAQDGWVPVEQERTSIIVMSWIKIRGWQGGHATYVGIGGGVFKTPWSDK
jgi:hypothetical protein